MHELGITFTIMNNLADVASKNNVEHISKVVLELGEVSTVIPEYLIDCWKWACKKQPLFSDSELNIETIQAKTYCTSCQKTFDTIKNGKICPYCGSDKTYLKCGNEFNIKEIEVDNI